VRLAGFPAPAPHTARPSRWRETLWFYRELANAFQRLLPGQQLADELVEIVTDHYGRWVGNWTRVCRRDKSKHH
jgi:hypothetical protein